MRILRRRVVVAAGEEVKCEACGRPPWESPTGAPCLYRYPPFPGAPLVCSRACDVKLRPALELEAKGAGR